MIQIRQATPADAAEIASIHIHSWREAYRGLLPETFLASLPLHFRARLRLWNTVTQSSSITLVAEHPEYGIVGFINGEKGRDEAYQDQAEICAVYLLEAFHRQKIGYRLLKAIFEELSQRGFGTCYLWVLKGNPTIAFYERCGARYTGDLKDDAIGGMRVQELRYMWDTLRL